MYHSLAKERPWTEHLNKSAKEGGGLFSSVAVFNHKRVLMSCSQQFDALILH